MPNHIDITGRRFGRLTVLKLLRKRASNRQVLWRCRCDCGKLTVARLSGLSRLRCDAGLPLSRAAFTSVALPT